MTTEHAHTLGPLTVGKLGNDADQWELYREDGRSVAYIVEGGEPAAERLALAYNHYDELVEALERLVEEIGGSNYHPVAERIAAARALLSRLQKGA